jgi:hypothetical protein
MAGSDSACSKKSLRGFDARGQLPGRLRRVGFG